MESVTDTVQTESHPPSTSMWSVAETSATDLSGEVYGYVEGGNGELGFYLVSDGRGGPYRCHVRPPCFALMQGLHLMVEGGMLADIIPTFDSINMIGGEIDR